MEARRSWAIVAGSLLAGLVSFRLLYPSLGVLAGGTAMLPGLIAAMLLGTKAGVLVALVSCVSMNAVLLVSGFPLWSLPVAVAGTACVIGSALLVSRMRALQERVTVAEREKTLAEARARVSTAERLVSLGTLAAGVAHEVNNPLAYVLANLRFAREAIESGDPAELDEAVRALKECETGAERMRSIVADMKRLSRNGSLDRSSVDVGLAVRSALNLVPASARSAELVTELHDVPVVDGSDAQVAQVVLNLVMNAFQAFPERGASNKVTVSVRPEGAHVLIRVADNGPGIPADIQSRVFDPFFTTKPPGVGTGLGLPLCQSFVASMGGTVGFQSDGQGTVFEVRLPTARG